MSKKLTACNGFLRAARVETTNNLALPDPPIGRDFGWMITPLLGN